MIKRFRKTDKVEIDYIELQEKYEELLEYSNEREYAHWLLTNSRSFKIANILIIIPLNRFHKLLNRLIHIMKTLFILIKNGEWNELFFRIKRKIRKFINLIYIPFIERKIFNEIKNSVKGKNVIILPPTIDWYIPLYQRPQQLAQAYSKKNNISVIYLTSNNKQDNVAVADKINKNLWVFNTRLISKLNSILEVSNSKILSISWTINKIYMDLIKYDKLIYEYIDELDIFDGYDKKMMNDHIKLCKLSDVTVCTATKLYNQAIQYSRNPILSPNAGDYNFFVETNSYTIDTSINEIINDYNCVMGYYGALADWFDYDLIHKVAEIKKEWLWVLVGMDYDGSLYESDILNHDNVKYIPPQQYEKLPSFLKAFDVATIPFKINEITLSTSPVKLFEYMAAGKPIITSEMPECLKYQSVMTYKNVDEYISLVDNALNLEDDDEYWNILKKDALDNTWDARTDEILKAIQDV